MEVNINFVPVESDHGRVNYVYDKLGRLDEKQVNVDAYNCLKIKNEYKYGTTSKQKITASYSGEGLSEDFSRVFENRYDARGRLTRENPVSEGQQAQYVYDKADRLTAEETSGGGYKTYAYNADGSLSYEQTGNDRTNYVYDKGRLVQRGDKQFRYDNLGNCTRFGEAELSWHRGSLLKSLGDTDYFYDAQGVRYSKKSGGMQTRYFHDGGKIIEEHRGNAQIKYLYDAEKVMGFKVYQSYYYFVKDASGSVRSVLRAEQSSVQTGFAVSEVARYDYDAWGNATVTNLKNAKIDGVDVADFNPIRWKSQYFDTESGFYYIGGRYYSPETKRYVDAGAPETAFANATTIYGLNLQNSTLTNPLGVIYNDYTIKTQTELTYDPPKLTKWQSFLRQIFTWYNNLHWGWKVGIGTAFIIGGLIASVASGGAFLPALNATVKAVGISIGVSASVGAVFGGIVGGWEGMLIMALDGAIDGYMWGGIYAGIAQLLGAASPILRNRQVNFADSKNWLYGNRNSLETTIIRVNKAGKQIWRLDAGVKNLFHLHFGIGRTMRIHRWLLPLLVYNGLVNFGSIINDILDYFEDN